MSLTITSWSLIGTFGGAAAGLFFSYPNPPKNYVLAGALAGGLAFGGGNYLAQSDHGFDFQDVKNIFINPDP